MTCCAEDINYIGFVCNSNTDLKLKNKGWYKVKAKIKVENNSAYQGVGPVLYILAVEPGKNLTKSLFTSPKERFRYDMRRYAALTMVSV